MAFAYVVFNAARENNLFILKSAISGRSPAEIAAVTSTKINGATPLLISCRNGHIEIVEYLLTRCNVDVEQVGSVNFDGEPIEDAKPLWCAAAAGHLNIVQLLVRFGANVNSTTRTNSTPLRAACFDGHFEIVKYLIQHGADFEVANRHGHTCLMIACYKGHVKIAQYLLSLNANVNRCSIKGNTALHDCADSGSLEILQLLLKHGARMEVDFYGMTPLLAASVTGHLPIVEHLLKLPCVTRQNRIDALELIGATYVDKKRDMVSALGLWRRAMDERNKEPKICKNINEPIAAYEYAVEFKKVEELDELVLDPDEMRMQALMIRQRILGPTHPDTSYYLRFRGAHYADAGRFDRCIDLWTYALTMQQKILPPLSPMTQSSLLSFTELFSFMLTEAGRLLPRGRVVPPIDAPNMLIIFNKAAMEVERGQRWLIEQQDKPSSNQSSMISVLHDYSIDPNSMKRAIVSTLHLGCLLAWLVEDPKFCPKLRREIMIALYKLNRLKLSSRSGRTPLHFSCSREESLVTGRYPACQFPSVALCRALLEVGADPNATDDEGNTPLHLIATAQPIQKDLIILLLEGGAHIDQKNSIGETFASIWKENKAQEYINPLKYTTLACLAARVIRQYEIHYRTQVPAELYKFIELH